MKMPKTPTRGFTLLELLVALAVFAIMAIAAYEGLHNVLFTRAAVEAQSQRLAAVQMTVFRLEQDIEQTVPRGIRDEYGEPQPALFGGALASSDTLTLTRTGWDNPLKQPRATLQRVAYRLQEGRLWRLYWPVLDRGGVMEPRETLLLDRVQTFKVRFLGEDGTWQDNWPLPTNNDGGETVQHDATTLPRAVEVHLTLEDWGEITRLFPLAG